MEILSRTGKLLAVLKDAAAEGTQISTAIESNQFPQELEEQMQKHIKLVEQGVLSFLDEHATWIENRGMQLLFRDGRRGLVTDLYFADKNIQVDFRIM